MNVRIVKKRWWESRNSLIPLVATKTCDSREGLLNWASSELSAIDIITPSAALHELTNSGTSMYEVRIRIRSRVMQGIIEVTIGSACKAELSLLPCECVIEMKDINEVFSSFDCVEVFKHLIKNERQ